MKVSCVKVGILETDCYVLEIDNEVLVIDPGGEYRKINKLISGKKVLGIIITHHHFDHIGAINDFDNAKLYDFHNLKEGINKIGKFEFEVIYTPGHKEDAISIYFKDENIMFVGDFVFKGGIGRTDLCGSSVSDMKKSLEKIKKYPMDAIVYPGHGDSTTLANEKVNI